MCSALCRVVANLWVAGFYCVQGDWPNSVYLTSCQEAGLWSMLEGIPKTSQLPRQGSGWEGAGLSLPASGEKAKVKGLIPGRGRGQSVCTEGTP